MSEKEKPILQGVLWKRARKSGSNWRKRYFKLFSTTLTYSVKENGKEKGRMNFTEEFFVQDGVAPKGKFGFLVTDFVTSHHLAADTKDQKEFWCHTIATIIRKQLEAAKYFEEVRRSWKFAAEDIDLAEKQYQARLDNYYKTVGRPLAKQNRKSVVDLRAAQVLAAAFDAASALEKADESEKEALKAEAERLAREAKILQEQAEKEVQPDSIMLGEPILEEDEDEEVAEPENEEPFHITPSLPINEKTERRASMQGLLPLSPTSGEQSRRVTIQDSLTQSSQASPSSLTSQLSPSNESVETPPQLPPRKSTLQSPGSLATSPTREPRKESILSISVNVPDVILEDPPTRRTTVQSSVLGLNEDVDASYHVAADRKLSILPSESNLADRKQSIASQQASPADRRQSVASQQVFPSSDSSRKPSMATVLVSPTSQSDAARKESVASFNQLSPRSLEAPSQRPSIVTSQLSPRSEVQDGTISRKPSVASAFAPQGEVSRRPTVADTQTSNDVSRKQSYVASPPQSKPTSPLPTPTGSTSRPSVVASPASPTSQETATAKKVEKGIASRLGLWQSKVDVHQEKQANNVFSGAYQGKSGGVGKDQYGKAPEGSKTEERAKAAQDWVETEIEKLIKVILEMGEFDPEEGGICTVKFGPLFYTYADISDTLVGILMRAKKRKRLVYKGDMLFQNMHDHVKITVLTA